MKKIIYSIILSIPLISCAQGIRVQPGGTPTPVPVFDIVSISNLIYSISININSNAVTDLASNIAFNVSSNNSYTIVTNVVNNYQTNAIITTLTNTIAPYDEYALVRYASNIVFERYWLDFGKTNALGQRVIYGHLIDSNFPPAIFLDITNLTPNSMISFNVTSPNTSPNPTRTIFLNTNVFQYPRFDTNGWFKNASGYGKILTNGNEFRMTIKTNDSGLSTLWQINTQP